MSQPREYSTTVSQRTVSCQPAARDLAALLFSSSGRAISKSAGLRASADRAEVDRSSRAETARNVGSEL